MRSTSALFSDGDRQRICDAVRAAEGRTSAEIVPVVARTSGRYERAADLCGLLGAVSAMIPVWLLMPEPWYELGRWDSVSPIWKLAALTAATGFGFLAGAAVAGRVGWLRRLFASPGLMHEEVTQRAYQFFYDQRVHRTAGASGVLIYVSLHERMASIIADQAVLDTLGKAAVAELCRDLTSDLKRGSLAAALCGTIEQLGAKLAPALPRAAGDVDELPDALVTVD